MPCDGIKVNGTDLAALGRLESTWDGVLATPPPVYDFPRIPGLVGVYDHGGVILTDQVRIQIGMSFFGATMAETTERFEAVRTLCLGSPAYSVVTLTRTVQVGASSVVKTAPARFLGTDPARGKRVIRAVLEFLLPTGTWT